MRLFITILFLPVLLFAQQKDSTVSKVLSDSLGITSADSLSSDSTRTKKNSDVDAVVSASSLDSLIYNVRNKKMFLYGSGDLKYKQTDLKSGKIFVDYDRNEIEAFGITDTSDTAKVKLKQTPVLTEGSDVYEGSRIKYNFKTQQGFISLAKNKEQTSRYEGEKVKKIDKDTYFIESGIFTTCEEDTPHTYFSASEMKVIQRDKIIAKWIFMHIGGVPFPIPLPFAVIPNESGRRSGIIIPTFGQEFRRGQYFRNFGYFFALSDYFDLALTGDYFTKGGYGLRSRLRYAKRYDFSGSFNAGYSKIIFGEETDPGRQEQTDWNFSLYHNQQIDPTSRLDVNLQFQSSNFFRNNSINYNDLLSQDIISNATYSKRWDESGNSLSINYSRTQNLSTGNIYESLPNIYFSKNITYPFKREGAEAIGDQKWYELIAYTYSGQFRNERRKTEGNLKIRGGVQHDLSFNASPKIGYFNVSPRIGYQEKWYNKRTKIENRVIEDIDPVTGKVNKRDTLVVSDLKELNFVRTFDMSVSASTKLYGIMQPNMLGIESFRHTLMPSISYSYQPDFADNTWGYYDSYTKSNGEVVYYDKYQNEIFGGAMAGQRQSLSFSLGNVFEIKTMKDPNDTTKNAEANKIQLLNLNASIGYNFAADSMKLSDLSLSYRTQIGQILSFDGSSTFTFYDYEGNFRVNRFLASAGKGLFRLTNFNFSISTNLIGEADQNRNSAPKRPGEDYGAFQKADYITLYDENESPDLSIPWNLNLSYNYNLVKTTPNQSIAFSNLSADLGFSLTKNWKFTVRGSYDFEQKQIITPQISIYRDLHCWEMNFTWNPIGTYRGFMFEIRMKAPELQDIKVSKSRGLYSGRR
ncbi:MAG TPA: putative LPS assembly protein LptD [Melioribacteraceae bacterium]|nr:putative LPS assembly protein LptD [Melioribacteraceae bacterium]